MKKNIFLLVIALLMASTVLAFPTRKTDRAIKKVLKQYETVGVAVAVVKDGAIVFNKSYGYKDLESQTPLRNDHLMRIASISKSFTATAMMQLVEQGKLSLDDDVSDLIGFRIRNPRFPNTPITVKMLLSHTATINDKGGYFTLDRLNPAKNGDCADAYLDYEPGKGYRYSNLGLNLAGTIVERVSGVRFDEYVRKNIIEPLGLNGGFNPDMLDASKFASLYQYRKGKFVKSVNAYRTLAKDMPNYVMGYSAPLFSPTGGMKISAHDLAIYMMMHMNYGEYNGVRIISEQSSKLMQTPVWKGKARYGLCLKEYVNYIDDDKFAISGRHPVGHNGSAHGLKSAMIFSPADGWGIVVLISGIDNSKTIRKEMVNAIYDACLKE